MITFNESSNKAVPPIFMLKPPRTVPPIQGYVEHKNRQNVHNFVHCVQPVYYVSRFYGLMPFSFKHNAKGEVIGSEIKMFDLVWFIVSIANYLTLAYLCWCTLRIPNSDLTYVLYFGNHVLLISGLLVGAFSVAFDMFNRHRLVEMTIKFNVFDRKMRNFGLYIDYEKHRRKIRFWYFVTTTVAFILAGLTFYVNKTMRLNESNRYIIIFYLSYLLNYGALSTVSTKYLFLLISLYTRHNQINNLLRNRFSQNDIKQSILIVEMNQLDTNSFIRQLGKLYDELCEIMDMVNLTYSFQIMMIMASTFLFSLLTCYSSYRYIISQNDFFREITIIHFNWKIFHIFYSLMIIYLSVSVSREAKRTSMLTHRFLNRSEDKGTSASLMQLSQQIQHRFPVATCGLFAYDWTLCFTMIGATTSYLTLLIQFDSHQSTANVNRT